MIGAARAVSDVLMYQPDFVGIDFSVNDDPTDFFKETYEGVLRKVLTWTSEPAVILLDNVYYDTGINAQEQHVAVGDWYHVTHVSIKILYIRKESWCLHKRRTDTGWTASK